MSAEEQQDLTVITIKKFEGDRTNGYCLDIGDPDSPGLRKLSKKFEKRVTHYFLSVSNVLFKIICFKTDDYIMHGMKATLK